MTWVNDELVETTQRLLADTKWELVNEDDGISVWRKYLR